MLHIWYLFLVFSFIVSELALKTSMLRMSGGVLSYYVLSWQLLISCRSDRKIVSLLFLKHITFGINFLFLDDAISNKDLRIKMILTVRE
jgi:hypothetical protein